MEDAVQRCDPQSSTSLHEDGDGFGHALHGSPSNLARKRSRTGQSIVWEWTCDIVSSSTPKIGTNQSGGLLMMKYPNWQTRIAAILGLITLAAPVAADHHVRVGLILLNNAGAMLEIGQEIEERLPDAIVERVVVQDCSSVADSAANLDVDALILSTNCSSDFHTWLYQDSPGPVVDIGFSEDFQDISTTQGFIRIRIPTIERTVREKIVDFTGQRLGTPFLGYCDSPYFVSGSEAAYWGPVGSCLSRPIGTFASLTWTQAVAETASAVLRTNNELGLDAVYEWGLTPFGQLEDPWSDNTLFLPGESIIDTDHPAYGSGHSGWSSSADFLVDAVCPECSGTGCICGDDCPSSCSVCTVKNQKQCCRGDGMGIPERLTLQ